MNISNFFVHVDSICDIVPGLSTPSNLVDLLMKGILFPFRKTEAIKNNHYFNHIVNKDTLRSVELLVPVVGQVAVIMQERHEAKQGYTG